MGSGSLPATACFLVEIGTEEMPPTALKALIESFESGITQGLVDAALDYGGAEAFATPRRLAVRINELARRQTDREVERKGPPVRIAFDEAGKATKAALKFAEGCGVPVDALDRQQTPKGEWLLFRGIEKGLSCEELLPGIVSQALERLPIPRRMRWGASQSQFVRPVHWVLMMLDDSVVPACVMDTRSGNVTYGHRFMAPEAIVLAHPDQYEQVLERDGKVIADLARRRKLVEETVRSSATALQGTAVYDEALLDEVAALVEWPVGVTGRFEAKYLELPPEVLIATLQEHQRYFPVRNDGGDLINAFITVSNIASTDPDQVRDGNERVVRPRLADAAFFFEQDQLRRLADRVESLGKVVFQKQLGSMLDKTHRVAELAAYIAQALGADEQQARRAALLSKADLVTAMVGEFPKLQGTMGRYYASLDGEPITVAAALEEQYLPRYAGAPLPDSVLGRVVSLADKIDTITGIFGIGQPPSGTRDPFGLRRQALGVLRIVIEQEADLDLKHVIGLATAQLPVEVDVEALQSGIYDYMMERLRAYYLEGNAEGFNSGMFDAVLARQPSRPLDFHRRMEAVREFSSLDEAQSLAAANKRIANILRTAKDALADAADPALCSVDAEKTLFTAMEKLEQEVRPLLENAQYRKALVRLAALREPVDAFFDDVMVMDDDAALRINRLTLLDRLRRLFLHVADLSRLQ